MRCDNCSTRLLLILISTAFAKKCYSFILPSSSTLFGTCTSNACQARYSGHNRFTQRLISRKAATTATEIDTETISVALPSNWKEVDDNWSLQAAEILTRYGVVALTSSNSDNAGLISARVIDEANKSATSRLQDMQSRITNRGVDPNGIEDGPFRFAEIICRDEGGLRYDVPLPWLGGGIDSGESDTNGDFGSGRIGAPLKRMETKGVTGLHEAIDEIVPNILEALWSKDEDDNDNSNIENHQSSSYVAASGFLINKPGSKDQNWHKDGPDAGFIDCFVPLVDLNKDLGPTAFLLNDGEDELVPMLNKGNILLFDYRTIHRGQGNTSENTTRTLAYAVYRRRERRRDGTKRESGDVHNFPAALTLEYD